MAKNKKNKPQVKVKVEEQEVSNVEDINTNVDEASPEDDVVSEILDAPAEEVEDIADLDGEGDESAEETKIDEQDVSKVETPASSTEEDAPVVDVVNEILDAPAGVEDYIEQEEVEIENEKDVEETDLEVNDDEVVVKCKVNMACKSGRRLVVGQSVVIFKTDLEAIKKDRRQITKQKLIEE